MDPTFGQAMPDMVPRTGTDPLNGIYTAGEEERMLEQQMALAHALRMQHAGNHSSPGGALGGAIANTVDGVNAGIMQSRANAGQRQLLDRLKAAGPAANPVMATEQLRYRDALRTSQPGSPLSGAYGSIYKQLTEQDPPEGLSAHELHDVIPEAQHARDKFKFGFPGEAVLDTSTGQVVNEGDPDKLKASKGTASRLSADVKDLNEAMKRANDLMNFTGGRKGESGKNQARVYAAERIQNLVERTGGNPTSQEMQELAEAVDAMIAQGGHSETTVRAILPDTYRGEWEKFKSKLLNEPVGQEAQAFVQRMGHAAEGIKSLAEQEMHDARLKALPSLAPYVSRHPNELKPYLRMFVPELEDLDPATLTPVAKKAEAEWDKSKGNKAEPEATAEGDKPPASGDTVHVRVDGKDYPSVKRAKLDGLKKRYGDRLKVVEGG